MIRRDKKGQVYEYDVAFRTRSKMIHKSKRLRSKKGVIMNNRSNEENLKEKMIQSRTVFTGRILTVNEDTVLLPNGRTSGREVIRHIGAVCVIPVTEDGCAIVERQYRYPLDEVITEIPAGKLDRKEEDFLEAGKRELREETGYSADKWTELGIFHPAAAYSDERIMMYLAEGLHLGDRELDEDEFLDVEKVPLTELVSDVMAGKISDSKTQVAVLKAARILGI